MKLTGRAMLALLRGGGTGRDAAAQRAFQVWGNVTFDWVKSDRLTYRFDLEAKTLVVVPSGSPDWSNLDLTPGLEYAPNNWLDLTGAVIAGYTTQTDDVNSVELTPRVGARVHILTYKVHLDGYTILPYLTGQEPKSPRREFFYFSDDCEPLAMRYENWKLVSAEQRMQGTAAIWAEPFTRLRIGKMFDLRADSYERADVTSDTYYDWQMDHVFIIVPSQAYMMQFIETFKEFPPRQKPATFGMDQLLEALQRTAAGR